MTVEDFVTRREIFVNQLQKFLTNVCIHYHGERRIVPRNIAFSAPLFYKFACLGPRANRNSK